MDESTNKSPTKVDAAPVIPKKSSEKDYFSCPIEKRKAEDCIEKEVVTAKKQKVEEQKSEVKTEVKVVEKKVDTSSEKDTSSLESAQQIKVNVSAKNGHVGSYSKDESSGFEKDASAAKEKPAVAAKNGHVAASEKKDESSDNFDYSSKDESNSDEDVSAIKRTPESLTQEVPIAPAKKTYESSEDADSSFQDQTTLDEDIAAANEAPMTLSANKSVISTQNKDESRSDKFDPEDKTCSKENVITVEKATAAPNKEGLVIAAEKKHESSSHQESAGEDDVTAKNTSAAVTKKKNVSSEETESDNETSSSHNDPGTPATPKEQTTVPKTLYVGNLSFSVEREDVEHFFKASGEVVNIRFAMNSDETFRGFGYVEFASAEAAEKALHELNGKELLRRPVRLDRMKERRLYIPYSGEDTQSFSKGEKTQGQTIFVRGFNKFDGQDQIRSSLEEYFGSCGEITRVSIPKDQDGVRGIAYIEFKDSDAFNKALELNGSEFGESTLSVKEAKLRGDSHDSAGGGRGAGRGGWRDFGGRSGWPDFGGSGRGAGRGGWRDFGGRSGWPGFGGRSGWPDFGGSGRDAGRSGWPDLGGSGRGAGRSGWRDFGGRGGGRAFGWRSGGPGHGGCWTGGWFGGGGRG